MDSTERILSPGQEQFRTYRGKPLRCASGAGTGKTTAIEERASRLIEDGAHPRSMLIMTFTRKAAEELRDRIRRRVGLASEDITIGTFHAVAAQELRRREKMGDQRWQILDQEDAEDYWNDAFLGVYFPMPDDFPAQAKTIRGKAVKTKEGDQWQSLLKQIAGVLKEIRSEQVNCNCGSEPFAPYALPRLRTLLPMVERLEKLVSLDDWIEEGLAAVIRAKTEAKVRDYDDTLQHWVDLLKNDKEYAERIRARYQHCMIDEYQDTNFLQEEVIRELNHVNLAVIGDASQCCYSWRNAVPELMIKFHERYPGTVDIVLQENRRSLDEVIRVANHVLGIHEDMLRARHDTTMARVHLKGMRGPGGTVFAEQLPSPEEETRFVFNEIERSLANGVAPEDIIVLSRTSFYLQPLEFALRTKGVPVQMWGGRSLMESIVMKDILGLLKLASRPGQVSSFMRVSKTVLQGNKERLQERLFFHWRLGVPLSSTEDAVRKLLSAPVDGKRAIPFETLCEVMTDINQLFGKLDAVVNLRKPEKASKKVCSVNHIVKLVLEYVKKLHGGEKMDFVKKQEFAAIEITLNDIKNKIVEEKKAEGNGEAMQMEDLLTQISLDPKQETDEGERVTLSTVHCSPPDESVLTTNGYKPISELDPKKDRIMSYMAKCNQLFAGKLNKGGTRKGYPFTLKTRPYTGQMLTIETAQSKTRVTPEHKIRVRYHKSFYNKWIVYLMRRGDWWRIGICTSANKPYKSGGLSGRLATEKGDDGWILGVYPTRKEALLKEIELQVQYGIPSICFESQNHLNFTTGDLHYIHEKLKNVVEPRAAKLLKERGLLIDSPLYARRPKYRFFTDSWFDTVAANLIGGYMMVPTATLKDFAPVSHRARSAPGIHRTKKAPRYPKAAQASVKRESYNGPVFSLDVLPHHYYVSGGAIVHNSAKGLEWKHVIVMGCQEGKIPYLRGDVEPPAEIIEEECRLLYVALTRAKDDLLLTFNGEISRFLAHFDFKKSD